MPREPTQQRRGIGGMAGTGRRSLRGLRPREPLPLVRTSLTGSGSTTCWAMSRNGQRIGGTGPTTVHRRTGRRGQLEIAVGGPCVAVRGLTIDGTSVLVSATCSILGIVSPIRASGWQERFSFRIRALAPLGDTGRRPPGRFSGDRITVARKTRSGRTQHVGLPWRLLRYYYFWVPVLYTRHPGGHHASPPATPRCTPCQAPPPP